MGLERVLLPMVFAVAGCFPKEDLTISSEKMSRYVQFAKKGEEFTSSIDFMGRDLSKIKRTMGDYHGRRDIIVMLYGERLNGTTSLATTFRYNGIDFNFDLTFMENGIIDGIPERILESEEPRNFKDISSEERKDMLGIYHQIINYVLDSLPKQKP